MATCFVAVCLLNLLLETDAQKNGFRGGSKSYEVHVEASQMGTNLHYELPESKVKAASTKDWLVDNDNTEMLAMNSPILATVNVKHPKFSMKGQWPGLESPLPGRGLAGRVQRAGLGTCEASGNGHRSAGEVVSPARCCASQPAKYMARSAVIVSRFGWELQMTGSGHRIGQRKSKASQLPSPGTLSAASLCSARCLPRRRVRANSTRPHLAGPLRHQRPPVARGSKLPQRLFQLGVTLAHFAKDRFGSGRR